MNWSRTLVDKHSISRAFPKLLPVIHLFIIYRESHQSHCKVNWTGCSGSRTHKNYIIVIQRLRSLLFLLLCLPKDETCRGGDKLKVRLTNNPLHWLRFTSLYAVIGARTSPCRPVRPASAPQKALITNLYPSSSSVRPFVHPPTTTRIIIRWHWIEGFLCIYPASRTIILKYIRGVSWL